MLPVSQIPVAPPTPSPTPSYPNEEEVAAHAAGVAAAVRAAEAEAASPNGPLFHPSPGSLPLMMAVLPAEWQPGTAVHVVLDSGHSALVTPPVGSKPGTNMLIPARIVGAPCPELGLQARRRYQPHPYARPVSGSSTGDASPTPSIVIATPAVQEAALAATRAAEEAIAAAARVTTPSSMSLSTGRRSRDADSADGEREVATTNGVDGGGDDDDGGTYVSAGP